MGTRKSPAKTAETSSRAPDSPVTALFQQIKQQLFGSKFFKVDLHFHTPASEDARGKNRYGFNPYQTTKYPTNDHSFEYHQQVRAIQEGVLKDARALAVQIVDRMQQEELSLVAITDHNGIGTIWPDPGDPEDRSMDLAAPTWYELISDEAERRSALPGQRPLLILPGTEISTQGVHILAIFPPSKPKRRVHFQICDLLTEVGIPVEDFGSNPKVGRASVADTLRLIRNKGGSPIIAHIDGSDQALLKLFELNGGAMRDVITDPALRGVEVVDPAKLSSKDKLLKQPLSRYFDSERKQADLDPLAYFQGSDAHDLATIGKRFTFVKMSSPSYAGLLAAIQVPSSRLRLSDLHEGEDSGLYLFGAQLQSPFLGTQILRFNRHLNCIVGRKESGKSQVFRLLEQAVNPDVPLEGDVSLFVDQRSEGKSNLYCFSRNSSGTQIFHIVEKDGAFLAEPIAEDSQELTYLRPKFYHEGGVQSLLEDASALARFLEKFFGSPNKENLAKLNEEFALSNFLDDEPSPLLVASLGSQPNKEGKKTACYELSLNTNWRNGKPSLVAFSDLSRSLRRMVIVSIILVTGKNGPLIIDEPGDHFDNEDIANYLVPLVKQLKDRRQIVFATGNSNLAINSDPDNYIVLHAEKGKLKELRAGFAIDNDEQRERLIQVLEGSIKSFRQRDRRYTLGKA